MNSIWIGYDARETEAFAVCRRSLRKHGYGLPINPIDLAELRRVGLYYRPTERRDGQLWDTISEAPMSTEFAISRFLTPLLANDGWALFMDCDIFCRRNLRELFNALDPSKAVMCVKHQYEPENEIKMDGQTQTKYARKNWSSVMAFNCDHPANKALTVELINTVPGRDLHRFCWLNDDQIGALDPGWNYLVGVTQGIEEPGLVHFTNGGPWFDDYRDVPFGNEWLLERRRWLSEDNAVSGLARTWEPIRVRTAGRSYDAYLA